MSFAAHRVHFGLIILGCFGGGSLYGWSGYMPGVRAHFTVSNAAASMVFSLALVSFTLGVLLGPLLLAKGPARLRLPLLAGLAVLSLALSGASAGFAGFVIAYGVCFGFIAGALYNHALSAASASGSATLLVPVSVAAFGLGGAVFGPVHVYLTASGWGLWSIAPALVCLSMAAAFAVFIPPAPEVDGGEQPRPATLVRPDETVLRLGVLFAAGSCSGLIVLGFAAQILQRGAGGVGLASLAIFFAAVGNTLGRLSSTLTAGRFGSARSIAGALILSMITLSGLVLTTAPGVIVGLLFLVAFAYGQLAATMPLLVRSQFSGRAFSGAFGWVFIGWGVAGLAGPWSAGWLLDATGTFRFSLFACIALAAFSLWLVLSFQTSGKAAEDC